MKKTAVTMRMTSDMEGSIGSTTETQILLMYTAYINDFEDHQEHEKVPEYIFTQTNTKSQLYISSDDDSFCMIPSPSFGAWQTQNNENNVSGKDRISRSRLSEVIRSDISQASLYRKENDSLSQEATKHHLHCQPVHDPDCNHTSESSQLPKTSSNKPYKKRNQKKRVKTKKHVTENSNRREKKSHHSKNWTERGGNGSKSCSDKTVTKDILLREQKNKKKSSSSIFDFIFPRVRQQKETERILKERLISVMRKRGIAVKNKETYVGTKAPRSL